MSLWVNCERAQIAEVVEVHTDDCYVESNHLAAVYRVGQAVFSRDHDEVNSY
jgi:hypothetical protein